MKPFQPSIASSGTPLWNPADYARSSDAQLQWARELQAKMKLQGHESLLDVGCGDGKITADFARLLPRGQVTGVDSSPEMVAYARRTYPAASYPNLGFEVGAAEALEAGLGSFDWIFSNATLNWVPDQPGFLRGARAVLRAGGRLILSCGGRGNAAQVLGAFEQVVRQPPWKKYFHRFAHPYHFHSAEEYQVWLAEAEFRASRCELVPKDMTQMGVAGLAAWIRTTWMPFTQQVPPAQEPQFIEAIVTTYLDVHPLDVGGLSHVRMVRLEVEAEKAEIRRAH